MKWGSKMMIVSLKLVVFNGTELMMNVSVCRELDGEISRIGSLDGCLPSLEDKESLE